MKKTYNIKENIELDYEVIEDVIERLEKYRGLWAYISNHYHDSVMVEYTREETDEEYKERLQKKFNWLNIEPWTKHTQGL